MTRAEVAARFVADGFAVIYQDCRGRYGSDGTFTKYVHEAADGYDTCAWLVAQPWCDGRICTMGLSYGGHTQVALGSLGAPGVVAQAVDSGGFANAWKNGARAYGAFELKQVTWAHSQAILSPEAAADPVMKTALEAENLRDWYQRLPWKPGHSPLRHHPDYEAYIFEEWRHGAFGPFWRQPGLYAEGHYDSYSDAATIQMSSWLDIYPWGQAQNYMGLRRAGKGGGRHFLILGPWTHGDRSLTAFGDVDFGPEATLDSWAGDWRHFRLRFFEHIVKGAAFDEPAVRVFVMGGGSGRRTPEGRLDHGGHWQAHADWPLPGTRFTRYHLHGDGSLSTAVPAAGAAPLAYDFDPAHPVPTIGHALNREAVVVPGGIFDQVESARLIGCTPPFIPLAARTDVLAFQTPPLEADLTLIGPLEADLWVETDGPDTDFTVKLLDVHPPSADYPHGYAVWLSDGILRLRYAEDPEHPRLRRPGEVTRVSVTLAPTAALIRAGHRLRVDVSSSNFPKYDVNPNTGEADGAARRKRVAVNTVYLDASRPSSIRLPVQPA
jgi:putative CocE/NonD family hydrolase